MDKLEQIKQCRIKMQEVRYQLELLKLNKVDNQNKKRELEQKWEVIREEYKKLYLKNLINENKGGR